MASLATRGGLKLPVDVLDPMNAVGRPAGITRALAGYAMNLPTNRPWNNAIRLGRQSYFESTINWVEGLKKVPITDAQLDTIAKAAETWTGGFDYAGAGISRSQQALERGVGRFGPQYLRSQIKMIMAAATPGFGLEQNLAREHLAGTIGTIMLAYTAAGAMLGQTPNLDPTEVNVPYLQHQRHERGARDADQSAGSHRGDDERPGLQGGER